MPAGYRTQRTSHLRALFCFGVSQAFFDADSETRDAVIDGIREAFADLRARFNVTVLGTMDDDQLMVGPSDGWPWTCYVLVDAPDLDAVRQITTIVRDWEVVGGRLWRFLRVEARVGRPLFFGND